MAYYFIKKTLFSFLLLFPMVVFSATVDEFIKDAKGYIDQQDFQAAVIQLKNALQKDGANKEARVLLGQTYLKVGNILSAEKELRRAKRAGAADADWMPYLADAYLAQRKTKEIIDELKINDSMSNELQAEMFARYGEAYLITQKIDKSLEQYRKAISLNPNQPRALLGIAHVSLSNKDFEAAKINVNKAIEIDANNIQGLTFAGEIPRLQGEYEKAKAAYQKALDVEPKYIPALGGLASSLISLKEFNTAEKVIDNILSISKNYPNAYYMKALIFASKKDFKNAESNLQNVFRITQNHLMAELLMGRVQYENGNFEQAEKFLKKFNNIVPKHLPTVKLLATTRLNLKDYDGAKKLLMGVESTASKDAAVLSLLGMAYAQSGEVAKGTEYFERAVKIAPEQAQLQAQLGVSHLVEGDIEEAIKNLESAVKINPADSRADMMLILAHLRNKDYDNALKVAISYAKKDSKNPITYNFMAAAYSGKKDYKKARRALEKALSIRPDFSAAEINLARLDLAEKSLSKAKKRFQNVIRHHPKNVEAHMELAKLAISQNNKEEGLRWIKAIRNKLPKALVPALVHIRFLLADKQHSKALDIAENVIAGDAENIEVLHVYAQTQVVNQRWKGALSTYEKLNQLMPRDSDVLAKTGIIQIKLGDKNGAKKSFEKALKNNPKHLGALVALANFFTDEKAYKKALSYAGKIQKIVGKQALGWIVEGDIYNAKKQPERAIKAYTKGLDAQKNNRTVVLKLAQTYQSIKAYGKAVRVASGWLSGHEKDIGIRLMLAQIYQAQEKAAEAAKEYEYVIKLAPDNLVALNNVAWIYAEQGELKGVVYGKKAYDLASNIPSIIDTYAWALLMADDDIKKALRLLQQVSMELPHEDEIRFHLGVAYFKNSKIAEAKREFKQLVKDSNNKEIVASSNNWLAKID